MHDARETNHLNYLRKSSILVIHSGAKKQGTSPHSFSEIALNNTQKNIIAGGIKSRALNKIANIGKQRKTGLDPHPAQNHDARHFPTVCTTPVAAPPTYPVFLLFASVFLLLFWLLSIFFFFDI